MSEVEYNSGDVVAWWDGARLCLGVLGREERQRWWLHPARGKAERVKPSRLALRVSPRRFVGSDAGEAARESLAELEAELTERAGSVEVPLLWELAVEEEGEGATVTLAMLADLALGAVDGEALTATARALVDDAVRFARKRDGWLVRDRRAVEGLIRQREQNERRAAERTRLLAGLRGALEGGAFEATGDETERRVLDAMEATAVWGDETPETVRRIAREALAELGVRGSETVGSFRVLRATGRFDSDDANLQLFRLDWPAEFPEDVVAAAGAASPDDHDRRDRTDDALLSIDSERTSEVDDALFARGLADDRIELVVSIADPGCWIHAGDAVDLEARRRALTHYFPDGKVLMLPPALAEDRASLAEDARRPAIRFRAVLDGDGAVVESDVERAWIVNRARWTYDAVDRALAEGTAPDSLALLAESGRRRLDWRLGQGGVHLGGLEAEVRATDEGPQVELRDRDAPSQILVAEAMILVGELAARRLADAGAPAIYRWQPEPDPPAPGRRESDVVEVFRLRRSMRRAEWSPAPRRHASLGLDAYVQVTSPLRRYQDLVGQRQLLAVLAGEEPPYDADVLAELGAATDRAERAARRLERDANEYWLMRWLEERQGEELEATVVTLEPRPLVRLEACAWVRPLSAAAGCEPGERVRVQVDRVDARAGQIRFRRV